METAELATRATPRGFTLIELMLALAILAMLLLLGMPSFTTFLRNSEIRSTSESIVNGLRAASAEAARQNTRVRFTLAGAGDASWAIHRVDRDTNALIEPPIQQYTSREAGANSRVTTAPADRVTVTFTGLGRVENQGVLPSDHVQMIDIASSVCGAGRPLRIIVDDPNPADPTKPRGLRMCDPDLALVALSDPRACGDGIPPPSC
jgi:type IV fimbrial biogenesis protein FimT